MTKAKTGTIVSALAMLRETAAALGLSYDQLRHCMRRHGLSDRAAA